MEVSTVIGIWVAALLTLCIYSFLYRDNPLYRFAEHLFVGTTAGYTIVRGYFDAFIPYVWEPLKHGFGRFSERELRELGDAAHAQPMDLIIVIPIILGLLFFMRFVQGYAWLVRIPIAFSFGFGAGLSIPLAFQANVYKQVNAAIVPFGGDKGWLYINITLVLIGTLATLVYFFFSMEHRGPLRGFSRLGIWFLMVGFGSAFGNTVMNRVMLLIQRVEFLLRDWLHLLPG